MAGIERAAEQRRITTILDPRYLSGKGDDFMFQLIAEADVEDMKLSTGGAHDEDPFTNGMGVQPFFNVDVLLFSCVLHHKSKEFPALY